MLEKAMKGMAFTLILAVAGLVRTALAAEPVHITFGYHLLDWGMVWRNH